MDPIPPGPPIISVELLNVRSVLLYNIPVGYRVNLICEYQTQYGLPSVTKIPVLFNDSYTIYDMRLALSDLKVYAVGHEGVPIPNATVSLIISATTIYNMTNQFGYVIFERLPGDVPANLQVSVIGSLETIYSDYVDIITSLNKSVVVNVGVMDLVIGVRNVEGEILHSVMLYLEKELTTLSLIPNGSGLMDVGLIAYGEYRVTIYIIEDGATLPSNFSDAYLVISSETPRLLFLIVDLGEITYSIDAPESGYQNSEIRIAIRIFDAEGRAISGLNVSADLISRWGETLLSFEAEEPEPGIYIIRIPTYGLRHGYYTFSICVRAMDQRIILDTV